MIAGGEEDGGRSGAVASGDGGGDAVAIGLDTGTAVDTDADAVDGRAGGDG